MGMAADIASIAAHPKDSHASSPESSPAMHLIELDAEASSRMRCMRCIDARTQQC